MSDQTMETRWWWVRHAPVTVNEGRIYGQEDLPCDTGDTAAFQVLATMLPSEAVLLTSTLQRTTQTAEAICTAGLKMSDPIKVSAFIEQSFGDWQGQRRDEFTTEMQAAANSYWLAPAYERAPNGESFTDLIARAVPAINKYSAEYQGRDIVAVTHGGTIRAAIGYALGVDPETALQFSVANLSVTRLDCIATDEGRVWRIGFVNIDPRVFRPR